MSKGMIKGMIEIQKPDETLSRLLPPVALRRDITYVPSQFVIRFEHLGKQYVFNNLTKQCIEGSLPADARAGEGYDDLILAQFLVPEDKDECAYYNSISALMRAYSHKKGVRGYTILPTSACNARCTYCYEQGMKPFTMNPETVEQTIRYIISSHAEETVSITWFGGEPLLAEEVIDRICEGLREAGIPYKSRMVSNGSLVNSRIIEKMTGPWHLEQIQVSMDGAEADYISRKCYLKEGDHYHSVMRSIDRMAEKGILVQVRCNVDEENWDGLPGFLDDMSASISHKENVGIYLAPLFQMRNNKDAIAFWKKVLEFSPLLRDTGFQVEKLKKKKRTSFRVNACMADGGSVVVCPDGVLSPCEHLQQEAGFGDVWNGVTDEAARYEFCRTDRTREKCRRCPCLPSCTSFANCPVQNADIHCREVQEIFVLNKLKKIVEKENIEYIDGEEIC